MGWPRGRRSWWVQKVHHPHILSTPSWVPEAPGENTGSLWVWHSRTPKVAVLGGSVSSSKVAPAERWYNIAHHGHHRHQYNSLSHTFPFHYCLKALLFLVCMHHMHFFFFFVCVFLWRMFFVNFKGLYTWKDSLFSTRLQREINHMKYIC